MTDSNVDEFVHDLSILLLSRNQPTSVVYRYYYNGVDVLHYPRAVRDVESLALKIQEPVYMAFPSVFLTEKYKTPTTVLHAYFPPKPLNYVQSSSGWLLPYASHMDRFSGNDEDAVHIPYSFVDNKDLTATLILSGASADNDFIDTVNIIIGQSITRAEQRLADLYSRAKVDVYSWDNVPQVLSGAEIALAPKSLGVEKRPRNVGAILNQFHGYNVVPA